MSTGRLSRLGRLAARLRHAFALDGPHGRLTERDRALLRRLAVAVVVRRMGLPALLFLQSVRPLNYVGSQALVFLRPFLTPLFPPADYERVTAILERRAGVQALIEAIHTALAEREGRPE